ncbi:MAG: TIGR04255 family protein [Armatimonadetes bacterium]|nr:TIGR04255 family protein [Armatimonadota bacterium]
MVILPFERLPLVEASVRITFRNQLPLGLAFIGDLYDLVRVDFELADDETLEPIPGTGFTFSQRSIEVATFNHRHHPGVSAKLQTQMLRASWQKASDEGYPGYQKALLPVLQKLLGSIEKLIGKQEIQVINMSYQNSITGIEPIGMTSFVQLPIQIQLEGSLKSLEFVWSDHSQIDQRVHVQGIKSADELRVALTNVAAKRLQSNEEIWTTLELIHDTLCINFRDSLTDRAKDEWGYGNS